MAYLLRTVLRRIQKYVAVTFADLRV